MNTATVRLVLLVSCAHALVHIYELAVPSSELLIAEEFQVGKETTGVLATCFRLPFGGLAVLVGWIVDRYGARKMLCLYLVGCAVTTCLVSLAPNLPLLFVSVFALGTFASMYHPAGLALISVETSPEHRARALGIHGVFGSAGVGGAPFLAFAILCVGATWRNYYALLAIPGGLLAGWFLLQHGGGRAHAGPARPTSAPSDPEPDARWGSFFLVSLFITLNGFVYAAYLTFLPRYLDGAGMPFESNQTGVVGNFLSGVVLLCGMLGQYVGGRLARPGKLEPTLAAIAISSAPFLIAMALVDGTLRVYAAAGFAVIHFMTQPVYNTLIADYVPRRRRSIGYGFSFMMAFGIGGVGSTFAGYADTWVGSAYSGMLTYGGLAAMAVLAGLIACLLWTRSRLQVPAA
jgi:MFS family permease